MGEPKSPASRAISLGLVAGDWAFRHRGHLTGLMIRSLAAKPPTWAEIGRAASRRRWAEVDAKLVQWIAANPEHTESRLMLAKLRLGLEHRDAALEVLLTVPESSASWTRVQMMLGELAIRERRAGDAERIFRRIADRNPKAIEPRQRLITCSA